MKKKFIQLLLLCSLFFNIAHATVIAMEEDCHHDSVSEYIFDTHVDDECGDLCDMHHLFHFMAIVDTNAYLVTPSYAYLILSHKNRHYTSTFHERNIKPPIA